MSAVATAGVELDRAELQYALCASLLVNALLANDFVQFKVLMRETVLSNIDFNPQQRADLIQKFTEALRA